MPESGNGGRAVTKADLDELETRLRIYVRDIETHLVKEFHSYARGMANVQSLEERIRRQQ